MWNQRVFHSLKQMIDCNYEIRYTEYPLLASIKTHMSKQV